MIYFVIPCVILSYVSIFKYACIFYIKIILNRRSPTLTKCTYSAVYRKSPRFTFLFSYIGWFFFPIKIYFATKYYFAGYERAGK